MNKKLSWSKILLIFLFLNFLALEIFIGGITFYSLSIAATIGAMPDLTPLLTLIGTVVGETLSYGIYAAKSKAENTEHGIVYETTMMKLQNEINDEEEKNVEQ